jgi:hypothetical protein
MSLCLAAVLLTYSRATAGGIEAIGGEEYNSTNKEDEELEDFSRV